VRRLIALTGQYAAVDETLTGAENLLLIGRLLGLSRAGARRRAAELLEQFSLADAGGRATKTYSGGMRRRLDLAACLVGRLRVLVLDEPTAGLDPASRRDLWALIGDLVDTGTTVLLTTQYLEEADQLADRVSIIDQGRIVAEGAPAALKSEVGRPRLDLRVEAGAADVDSLLSGYGQVVRGGGDLVSISLTDEQSDVTAIIKTLADAGATVRSLDLVRPSLEDVFIAKTGRRLEGAGKEAEELSVIARG
jgi:oleandomycin transport system ATP-binding protein